LIPQGGIQDLTVNFFVHQLIQVKSVRPTITAGAQEVKTATVNKHEKHDSTDINKSEDNKFRKLLNEDVNKLAVTALQKQEKVTQLIQLVTQLIQIILSSVSRHIL